MMSLATNEDKSKANLHRIMETAFQKQSELCSPFFSIPLSLPGNRSQMSMMIRVIESDDGDDYENKYAL